MAVNRSTKVLLIAGIIALVAWVIIGSMARVERACELCIEFNGRAECRRADRVSERAAPLGAVHRHVTTSDTTTP